MPSFRVFEAIIPAGVILWHVAGSMTCLKSRTAHIVFIIPMAVRILMLCMTAGDVSGIHRRFDRIEDKLDSMDGKLDKLDKLDSIESLLKEIAGYLNPDKNPK